MTRYELNALFDLIHYKDKTSWEQTRMQNYITAQVNSTKKISPQDLMTFPWEEDSEVDDNIDKEDMFEMMRNIENQINNE